MTEKTDCRVTFFKQITIIIAVFVMFSLFGCGSSAPAARARSQAAETPAPAQSAPPRNVLGNGTGGTAAQPRAAAPENPYYTGDGGRGKSIAILVPSGRGLAPEQNYLPVLVQGVLVTDMAKYSSMRVLDRVSLDSVVTETESGIYQNEDDFIQFGQVANVGYAMSGSIVKTTTGYNLSIQITDTKTGATAASYSGACTAAELDNHAGIRKASIELLGQMGVRLTDRARRELGAADSREAINGQTALARGITSQKSGTTVEAMSYYYRAAAFDPALLEAANRVSVMSAAISSGNIGENVRNDIQRRDEWERIMREASDFFTTHPPYEIIYNPNLIQGDINFRYETVTIRTSVMVSATPDYKIIRNLNEGMRKARDGKNWRIREINADLMLTIQAALINESGQTIGTPQSFYLSVHRGKGDSRVVDFVVKQSDLSDTMGVSITSINDMDMQTVQARNYISVSAFDFTSMDFGGELLESDIIITGAVNREKFNGVIPRKIFHWPVAGIGPSAFANNQLESVTIPNSVTSIGANAFSHNQLQSVIIPNTVISIGAGAFAYNQLQSVMIPAGITEISNKAFSHNQLQSVTIPAGITSIGESAFTGNQLQSVTIPGSVTSIGGGAFASNQLQSVTIPDGITSISGSAFANNQLQSVVIPPGVRRIEASAFSGNPITTITIGADVELNYFAFDNPEFQLFFFARAYNANNRKAGTYTLRRTNWSFKEAQ